jgi:hypothetical protein
VLQQFLLHYRLHFVNILEVAELVELFGIIDESRLAQVFPQLLHLVYFRDEEGLRNVFFALRIKLLLHPLLHPTKQITTPHTGNTHLEHVPLFILWKKLYC